MSLLKGFYQLFSQTRIGSRKSSDRQARYDSEANTYKAQSIPNTTLSDDKKIGRQIGLTTADSLGYPPEYLKK